MTDTTGQCWAVVTAVRAEPLPGLREPCWLRRHMHWPPALNTCFCFHAVTSPSSGMNVSGPARKAPRGHRCCADWSSLLCALRGLGPSPLSPVPGNSNCRHVAPLDTEMPFDMATPLSGIRDRNSTPHTWALEGNACRAIFRLLPGDRCLSRPSGSLALGTSSGRVRAEGEDWGGGVRRASHPGGARRAGGRG